MCIDANVLLLFYHSLAGTLPNVTIVSIEPSTTGTSIEIDMAVPVGIRRTIVGYERHDLGVTLQGEYTNIDWHTRYTFSSLVPGARYTVVVQGLSGLAGDRSQHVTREDVKTTETGVGYSNSIITYYLYILDILACFMLSLLF